MDSRQRVLILMFWAWVGGVCCDQAMTAWTTQHVGAGITWTAIGAALAVALAVALPRALPAE